MKASSKTSPLIRIGFALHWTHLLICIYLAMKLLTKKRDKNIQLRPKRLGNELRTEWSNHERISHSFCYSQTSSNKQNERDWETKTDISTANHKKTTNTREKNNTHTNYSIDLFILFSLLDFLFSLVYNCDMRWLENNMKTKNEKRAFEIIF